MTSLRIDLLTILFNIILQVVQINELEACLYLLYGTGGPSQCHTKHCSKEWTWEIKYTVLI